MEIPSTTAASIAFSSGKKMPFNPCCTAMIAAGKAPFIGLITPSSDNSPSTRLAAYDSGDINPVAPSIPRAIGRSKALPSFFMSAGARLTVILSEGNSYPEFFMEALTLSLLSRTAPSARPTVEKAGSPREISTSTSTIRALIPTRVKLKIFANMHSLPQFITHMKCFLFPLSRRLSENAHLPFDRLMALSIAEGLRYPLP